MSALTKDEIEFGFDLLKVPADHRSRTDWNGEDPVPWLTFGAIADAMQERGQSIQMSRSAFTDGNLVMVKFGIAKKCHGARLTHVALRAAREALRGAVTP